MAADAPRALHVLLDTNVVLDWLLDRKPWSDEAQPFGDARDCGTIVAYLPASVLTDVSYISRRQIGIAGANAAVDKCLDAFEVLMVDRATLEVARRLPGSDFEDNVQIACATREGLDLIVTRDPDGFRDAPMPAVEPAEAVRRIAP